MKISVVIPAYNRAATIGRAIASVSKQTVAPHEIIVVDDGSDDATAEVVKTYDGVLLLRQNHQGVSAARNNGAMMSEGEWIAFLDSDDAWMPDKLEKQIRFHETHPELPISYTDERWIRNGKEVPVAAKFAKYEGDIFERCLDDCIVAPSSVMVKKVFFDRFGGFDESFEVCEDYELWLRMAHETPFGLIGEKLIVKYGGHADQLSRRYRAMDRWRVRALEKLRENGIENAALTEMLRQKYRRLLDGARRSGREEAAMHYAMRLNEL